MKIRKEKSGLHLFERKSGIHVLFDEIKFNNCNYILSPRTMSIALINRCNLNCAFCYANKDDKIADFNFLKVFCKKIDELGVLEITLGGGEPFLYPNLIEFCNWVWKNTALGINITTNASLIDNEKVAKLKDVVSSIRVSIEAIDKEYENIRNVDFNTIRQSILLLKKNKIITSVNCTVLKGKVFNLENVIKFAIKNKLNDVLIIAEHDKGTILLNNEELREISKIIQKYQNKIQLNVTDALARLLDIDILQDEDKEEFSFSHLSVDKKIKYNSYLSNGAFIDNIENLKNIFINQYKQLHKEKS